MLFIKDKGWSVWVFAFCCFVFVRCDGNSTTSGVGASYTVGGAVSGLSGTAVLQNNSGDNLTVSTNGSFTFATAVADGAAYAVTVLTQPSTETCSVSSGTGTISGANITNVSVVCSPLVLPSDAIADSVLGQPGFTTNTSGATATNLSDPSGMVIDPKTGRLYVADALNNRILSWPSASGFANDDAADRVFGQGGSFTSNDKNKGGVSADSLNFPRCLALDSDGDLYVTDIFNHRVLRYNDPLTDTTADAVFGQPDFTSNTDNNGGVSASSLNHPVGLAIDSSGNLYVADLKNNRVLRYGNPMTNTKANAVFGQPNFTSNTANLGGISASSLDEPQHLAFDNKGDLYVTDQTNNRLLVYGSCGDGRTDSGEQCDDGNAANGDGCSSSCAVESGF